MLAAAPQDKATKDLPPPFVHQDLLYTQQWKQLDQKHLETLLDLVFVHDNDNIPIYLVGCTQSGQVCIWRMPTPQPQ